MINKIENFDIVWNKYYWAIVEHKNEYEARIELLETFNNMFINEFEFFLSHSTYFDLSKNSEKYANKINLRQNSFDEIIINKKYFKNFLNLIENNISNLTIFKYSKDIYFLEHKRRLLKIKFNKLTIFNKSKTYKLKSNEYRYFSGVSYFLYRKFSFEYVLYVFKRIKTVFIKISKSLRNEKEYTLKEISLKQFLKLNIEHKNSFNWEIRKNHLNIVTNNGKIKKIKKIIKFVKKSDLLKNVSNNVFETDTTTVFDEPLNINKKFWMTGNNFFIYPILFQFKKNVVPYFKANEYIQSVGTPMIYSFEYFDKLENMNSDEIAIFLKENTIEITNNCITGGRHRVFAMIGRLVQEKEYIPFYAMVK